MSPILSPILGSVPHNETMASLRAFTLAGLDPTIHLHAKCETRVKPAS
jgi:hypothetical protein